MKSFKQKTKFHLNKSKLTKILFSSLRTLMSNVFKVSFNIERKKKKIVLAYMQFTYYLT